MSVKQKEGTHEPSSSRMRTCRRPQLTDRARAGRITCRGSAAMAPAVCQFGRERLRNALPSSVPAG